jgi:6-phosphogluconolactonase
VANIMAGNVAVLAVKPDGSLGEQSAVVQHTGSGAHPFRQKGPRPHAILLSQDDRFALVCDLGLDKIFSYRFDAAGGSLSPNAPPFSAVKPGAGPRHMALHPSGRFLYVLNELQSSMTVFYYDPGHGALKELQTLSTLPAEFTGENAGAEVQVHPSGRFVYASNRGHESIAVFAVDRAQGTLVPVQYTSRTVKSRARSLSTRLARTCWLRIANPTRSRFLLSTRTAAASPRPVSRSISICLSACSSCRERG